MTTPTVLTGSDAIFARDARRVGDLPEQAPIEVTLRLRARRLPHPASAEDIASLLLDASQYAMLHGASAADMTAVAGFAAASGLAVASAQAARRAIMLRASPAAFAPPLGLRVRGFAGAGGARP